MQPAFRINIRNLPRQVAPATCARALSSTPRNMAFFPQPQIFSPFFRLIDEVERSFPQTREAFTACAPALSSRTSAAFSPRVNVSEEQTQYLLQAEIPGYEQKDVEIEWTDSNTLTISGRQQSQTESGNASNIESEKTPAAVEAAPASPALSAHQPSVEDAVDEDAPNKDEWVDLPSVETESASTTTTTAAPTPATTVSQPAAQPVASHQPQTKYWVKERSVGQFSRSFQFPNRVDHENVKASLKNGVLSVVVPKARLPEKRRIVVE